MYLHNNTRSRRRPMMYVCNITPWFTPHSKSYVNQGVLCCEHAEQASSSGVLGGGGGQQACYIKEGGATGTD